MPEGLPTVAAEVAIPIGAGLVAVLVVTGVYHLLRHLGRRSRLARDLVGRAYRPSQLFALLGALWLAVRLLPGPSPDWRAGVLHILLLGIILAAAWLTVALLHVLTELALRRMRLDSRDGIAARRIRTRIQVTHRVTLAFISVLAVGIMLITFEEVRAVGVSLVASAGLIGIIAALAAQSVLSNIFAGLQVAFGDALRLGDIVVVEGEWGRVEEITLRQVVIKIWDERRLILPTSYFTTTPFENWTKSERQLLGTVELDVDWSVPVAEMRAELRRILAGSDRWDGRACGLEVIDATGSLIRVRATVSAADAGGQWELRCYVREQLVDWLRQNHPAALPRVRTEFGRLDGVPRRRPPTRVGDGSGDGDHQNHPPSVGRALPSG